MSITEIPDLNILYRITITELENNDICSKKFSFESLTTE